MKKNKDKRDIPVRIQITNDKRRGIKYEIGLPEDSDDMDSDETKETASQDED